MHLWAAMQIDIRSNVLEISRWLDDAQKKQIPFATVYAMTLTAKDVAWEEIGVMQRVFDRPTPYTLNALQVKPAKKQTMVASVEFREASRGVPAKRFLNPNVNGGPRSQKSHEIQIARLLKGYSYLVPARGVPLDGYGNMPGSTLRKIISQLKVSENADANASVSRKSRRKRRTEQYFINPKGNMVLRRHSPHTVLKPGKSGKAAKGRTAWMIEPVLIGVRSPNYRKRFPFHETAEAVIKDRFPINFEIAFQRAMGTSGFKGQWASGPTL